MSTPPNSAHPGIDGRKASGGQGRPLPIHGKSSLGRPVPQGNSFALEPEGFILRRTAMTLLFAEKFLTAWTGARFSECMNFWNGSLASAGCILATGCGRGWGTAPSFPSTMKSLFPIRRCRMRRAYGSVRAASAMNTSRLPCKNAGIPCCASARPCRTGMQIIRNHWVDLYADKHPEYLPSSDGQPRIGYRHKRALTSAWRRRLCSRCWTI